MNEKGVNGRIPSLLENVSQTILPETRTELKAAKRKMGFNYQQFLTARKKWEQLKRAVNGDCLNGESASCPHI